MKLKFHHQYDGKWAAFTGKKGRFIKRTIIFPEFTPKEGRVYNCVVRSTGGVFAYDGEYFDVACASLDNSADPVEVFEYNMDRMHGTEQKGPNGRFNQLASALSKAGFKPSITLQIVPFK